jgi:ankyrin repeat protein
MLIEFGAEVNARGKDGNTPLHCAAEEGWERIEQILIEVGFNV